MEVNNNFIDINKLVILDDHPAHEIFRNIQNIFKVCENWEPHPNDVLGFKDGFYLKGWLIDKSGIPAYNYLASSIYNLYSLSSSSISSFYYGPDQTKESKYTQETS